MKESSNTEAELKKSVAYNKACMVDNQILQLITITHSAKQMIVGMVERTQKIYKYQRFLLSLPVPVFSYHCCALVLTHLTFGFLALAVGIKWEHWPEIGELQIL